MPSSRLNKKLSNLISTQLPEYITSEFPFFRSFIENYYKYIEQDQGAQELIQNSLLYSDIDKTINGLLDIFADQYIKGIPRNILADKPFFIKLASELYTRKGTEESFRILFRLLFNEEIDFFYPSSVILKPSDSKWNIPHIIRVNNYVESPFNLAGTRIRGNISTATAIVETVISFNYGSNIIYELALDPSSIKGNFLPNEQIISKKLSNAITGSVTTTVANINSILSKVDIIYSGPGYSVNDVVTISDVTGTGSKAYVHQVYDSGKIKSIVVEDYGINHTVKPKVTIGPPSRSFRGIYDIKNTVITVKLLNEHDLIPGSNVILKFSGNTSSILNGSTRVFTVENILDKKTFTSNIINYIGRSIKSDNVIITVDSGLIKTDEGSIIINTNGNVDLTHTLDKFFRTPFVLKDNVINIPFPIEHDFSIGDVVKIIFDDDIQGESYTGNFSLINNNNVTVKFNTNHGLNTHEKINVRYDYNYSNSLSGIYNLTALNYLPFDTSNTIVTVDTTSYTSDNDSGKVYTVDTSNISVTADNTFYTVDSGRSKNYRNQTRIDFYTYPHYFSLGQNVNVDFKLTLTNGISGSFLLENDIATMFFDNDHNFVLNEDVNLVFSNAKLIDDKDKILIKGNANISFASNVLLGNDTKFTSNIFAGNIISVGRLQEFEVAHVLSDTVAYLTSNSEYTQGYSNVYISTSVLNNSKLIKKINQIPNKRRIYVDIPTTPNATGTVLVSSIVSNVVQNLNVKGIVTNNGYPYYNYIDVKLPLNTASANARGVAIVSNSDTSNIIGNMSNLINISSVLDSKTIIFDSSISSNIRNTSGVVTVTVALPKYANYFHDGSCTLSTGDVEEILPEVNLTGDIVFYYNSEAITEYGVLRIPDSKTIEIPSVQPNTRGRLRVYLYKDANLEANIGAVGIGLGKWKDHAGILDETFKLQGRIDTNLKVFYQTFSYVIKSSKALDTWEKIVKQNIHPAGFEIFSEVGIKTTYDSVCNVTAKANFYPIKILGSIDSSFTSIKVDTTDVISDNLT